jgi:hypothetical protein
MSLRLGRVGRPTPSTHLGCRGGLGRRTEVEILPGPHNDLAVYRSLARCRRITGVSVVDMSTTA